MRDSDIALVISAKLFCFAFVRWHCHGVCVYVYVYVYVFLYVYVYVHNVVAKTRDASTELLQRFYGYMREHTTLTSLVVTST